MTPAEVKELIDQMMASENHAYKYSDNLARIGSEEIRKQLVPYLMSEQEDIRYLAAITLSKMEENADAILPLLQAINHPPFQGKVGGLVEALEGFDLSDHFVDIFKLYLSPQFKTSAMAKELLDFKDFDITPRTLRKAEKHWHHFSHNTPHDEVFLDKKAEVEAIFHDLRSLLGVE